MDVHEHSHLTLRAAHQSILPVLLTLFLCRALAADSVVPPWQGPDEPSHFVLAKLLATPGESRSTARVAIEREVLQSMARHHWWELYDLPAPQPAPQSFADVSDRVAIGTLMQPTYYGVAAAALRLVPGAGVEADYRTLRFLSIVLSALALACGFAGTRLLFGEVVAAGAGSIVALSPQFLLTAISVNPDVLINLCGAFVWLQAARLTRGEGRHGVSTAALIVGAAIVSALAKRNGIPLLVVAAVVLAVAFLKSSQRATVDFQRATPDSRRWLSRMPVAVAVGAAGIVALLYFSWERLGLSENPLLIFWSYMFIVRRSVGEVTLSSTAAFVSQAIDTSWLVAGWLRFPAPDLWRWTARLLTVAGLVGAARLGLRSGPIRRPLAIAWVFAGIQVAALLGITFTAESVPQGRYLFSALVPLTVLLWLGLQDWVPERARPYAGLAIVGVFAVLDATGFATVLLRTYLPFQAA